MDCPQCHRECGQKEKFCSECGCKLCSANTPVTGSNRHTQSKGQGHTDNCLLRCCCAFICCQCSAQDEEETSLLESENLQRDSTPDTPAPGTKELVLQGHTNSEYQEEITDNRSSLGPESAPEDQFSCLAQSQPSSADPAKSDTESGLLDTDDMDGILSEDTVCTEEEEEEEKHLHWGLDLLRFCTLESLEDEAKETDSEDSEESVSVSKDETVSKETMSYAQLQEPEFIRTIIPHLRIGIENFKALADILLEYDESKNQAIQQVICKEKESLDQADAAASAHLSKVDEYIERLTAQKGELDKQHKNTMKDLENLETGSQNLDDCMENSRVALDDAQRSLDSAMEILADLEVKHRGSQTFRNVGIGMMFIPIVGTIAGAIMYSVSQVEMGRDERAINVWKEKVKNCEREVKKSCDELNEKKNESMQKKYKIAKCKRNIEEIKQRLVQVSAQRNSITQMQEKVRRAVHLFDTLGGRDKVEKTHTEHVICLTPVVNILGEIIELMLQILENRKYDILSDPEVSAVIQSLQDIYKNISASRH